LTSKGQTTIPREVREFLKLNTGDRLEFTLNEDGKTVTIRPANIEIAELKGLLRRKGMKPFVSGERRIAARKRAQRG
jgi:AbrB family looped-hinge helix DNA binding protein